MKQTIHSALQSVGVFGHYCGYQHFILAVTLAAKDPQRLQNICKEIYVPVAEICHAEVANVEKNIRTVRDVMMRNGGDLLLAKMTNSPFWKNKSPYPKEIIEIFSEYFSDELKETELTDKGFLKKV